MERLMAKLIRSNINSQSDTVDATCSATTSWKITVNFVCSCKSISVGKRQWIQA
jgi:hypothetical protein